MKRVLLLSLLSTSILFSAAYQIPYNSVNSIGLAGANVANAHNAHNADTAYFNPANMVHNKNYHEIEGSLTYVAVDAVNYKSSNNVYDISSQKDDAIIPSFHYVSKSLTNDNIRIGFSLVSPAGLSREWTNFPALPAAEKYALTTIEFNPSLAIQITKKLSVGLGLRYMSASTDISLNGSMLPHTLPTSANFKINIQDAKADAFAYNLAISYKPTDSLSLSATYRSNVNLNFTGAASVEINGTAIPTNVAVKAIVPDSIVFAGAYKCNELTTVEVALQITLWSRIKEQNFNYSNATVEAILGDPITKKWRDTYAYRLGVTHKLNKDFTLMGGLAYETDPTEEKYVSFTTAQSKSMTYALGGRYKLDEKIELGLSAIYVTFEDRTTAQASSVGVNGTLSGKGGYGLTAGISYKF